MMRTGLPDRDTLFRLSRKSGLNQARYRLNAFPVPVTDGFFEDFWFSGFLGHGSEFMARPVARFEVNFSLRFFVSSVVKMPLIFDHG